MEYGEDRNQAYRDYLKDLEEGLYEWDYRGITTQGQPRAKTTVGEAPQIPTTFEF